jgi:hypothetical protein
MPDSRLFAGRKKDMDTETYRQILLSMVTPAVWKGIVQRAHEQAADGDEEAIEWLKEQGSSEYIAGGEQAESRESHYKKSVAELR